MKIRIIDNVIVPGIGAVHPGDKEPTIIDVEDDVAANLFRIGCAVKSDDQDTKTQMDQEEIIAEQAKVIEKLKARIAKLEKQPEEKAKTKSK